MTIEDALELIAQALESDALTQLQREIFREAWEGKSYDTIARTLGYDPGYIKDAGSRLWQQLSKALGGQVTKKNFLLVLRRYAQANKLTQSTESRCSWEKLLDLGNFYGREAETEKIAGWIQEDSARVILINGIGGVGKTCLGVKVAEQIQDNFEYLIWRSLESAPPLAKLLTDILLFLEPQPSRELPTKVGDLLDLLMVQLRSKRCIIVLDNIETLFQSCERVGTYRPQYAEYKNLITRFCDERHNGCLLLTSREKPKEISIREGRTLPVRSLTLMGLDYRASQQLLEARGLIYCKTNYQMLSDCYHGNPLALINAAATIQSVFAGDVQTFVRQSTVVVGDIREVLTQQFTRLSSQEKAIMYWLATSRTWLPITELQQDLLPKLPISQVMEILQSLQARSLVESTPTGCSQQPVIMEFITDQLIEQVFREITTLTFDAFHTQALIKAETKDYIRETQVRLILEPIIERLQDYYKTQTALERQLAQVLLTLRNTPQVHQGYGAGNLLNLYWQFQTNLSGYDFSHLTIRQAYLPTVKLHYTNFSHTHIHNSIFAQTFGGVTCVAYSPDGKLLASCDTRGQIQICSAQDGKQLLSWRGHAHWVWAVAFTPNGQTLVSVADDYLVKLWDATTGECLQSLSGHTYSVNAIAISTDGQLLATSGQDTIIRLWDITHPGSAEEILPSLQGHTERVWSLVFSQDNNTLISCSEDLTIKIWNLTTGTCVQTLPAHSHWIRSIALSPDGEYLASASYDCTIQVRKISTGECVETLSGHLKPITCVAFSPDGQFLVSSSFDQTLKLWNLSVGDCETTFYGHSNRAWTVAFHPNGKQFASGGDDHATKLWNLETRECEKTLRGHTNSVLGIAVSPDAKLLAGGYEDQTVRLWDFRQGQYLKTLYGHTNRVWSVAFAPVPITVPLDWSEDNQSSEVTLLASGSADYTIKFWHPQTGQCLQTLRGHSSWVWSVVFSPDGTYLASASYDQTVKLWEVKTGKCLCTFEGHSSSVVAITFSPNGQYLVSSGFDTTIKIWEVKTGQCLTTLSDHENSVWSLAFSPDSQWLASASFDTTVRIWDFNRRQCAHILAGHNTPVAAVAYSPDGQSLISGGFDCTLRIWDVRGGFCRKVIKEHLGLISSLLWFKEIIISASFDESIKLWDARGNSHTSLVAHRPYEGMEISGVTGLSDAEKATLKALGAVESGLMAEAVNSL